MSSIAILSASVSRAGGGILHPMLELAHGLTRRGESVEVYALRDPFTEADRPLWRDVPLRVFARGRPRALSLSPAFVGALAQGGHRVTHLHGLWTFPSIAVSLLRRLRRMPLVVSPHGQLDAWALRRSQIKKRIARRLYEDRNLRTADCLHALHRGEAQTFRALGFTNPIAIIPNGVTPPEDGPLPPRPASLGADDRNVLLFLGRLHAQKGVMETLQAWALVKAHAPSVAAKWRLVIAGWDDGGHEAGLRAASASLGLDRDVTFFGPAFGAAKHALLSHAKAFILASHSEGLPIAVLEAWAYRLPAFLTEACNLPDALASGAAAEITTDPQAMARTLAAELADSDLAYRGQLGRALVEQRYRWDTVVAAHHDVYRTLQDGGPAPACMSAA